MTIDSANPTPPAPLNDGLAQHVAYERQKADSFPFNKSALLLALSVVGVSVVVVTFDGYGDSGQIEDVEARAGDIPLELPDRTVELLRADWSSPQPQPRSMSLRDAAEALAWDILSSTYGGWGNDDGAFGEVMFDVKAGVIRLDYNARFSDSEFFQHTF